MCFKFSISQSHWTSLNFRIIHTYVWVKSHVLFFPFPCFPKVKRQGHGLMLHGALKGDGIIWSRIRHPQVFYRINQTSTIFMGHLQKSTIFMGHLQKSTIFMGYLQKSTIFMGYLQTSTIFMGYLQTSTIFMGYLHNITTFMGLYRSDSNHEFINMILWSTIFIGLKTSIYQYRPYEDDKSIWKLMGYDIWGMYIIFLRNKS